MISQLIQALNVANTEALLVSMPDAVVVNMTEALLVRWGANQQDVIGKPVLKFGIGLISARQIESPSGAEASAEIEVCYTPPLGRAMVSRFKPQKLQLEGKDLYLFVSQHLTTQQASAMAENETRLSLALRSGGYALWDYNYETNETYNSPEMLEVFGLKVDGTNLNFHSFNQLIHPMISTRPWMKRSV